MQAFFEKMQAAAPSGQSPRPSSRPDGRASLRSLAPPLPNKPASPGPVSGRGQTAAPAAAEEPAAAGAEKAGPDTAQRKSSLAMIRLWIWLVPSKIWNSLASRMSFSTGYSLL